MTLKACRVCALPSCSDPTHRPHTRNVTPSLRERILDRDHWTCQECGIALTGARGRPHSAHIGHRVALIDGGGDTDGNLYASCRACNERRGTTTKE